MTPAHGVLTVFADGEALARGAAAWLTARAEQTTGTFTLCLAGGSTPKRLYEALASPPLRARFPWARTEFLFGDERFVPPDDPASNARMARDAMFAHVQVDEARIHAVPTIGLSPDDAASAYERTLQRLYGVDRLVPDRPLFNVTLLGVGEDGHTASLIPGEPVLAERTKWVGTVAHGRPETRITLTFPPLSSSAAVLFLLQGASKRPILNRLLSGDDTLPAGQLRPTGELHWFADAAAAGDWA